MPRGRASEIFLCAARVVVVAPLGQSAQHGATDGDALSLAVPERSVLSMRLISLIGRPGVEVSLYARLLSARLRAELLAVPPAAAAEVAHGTHLGKQLSAAAAGAVGKPLPSNLVAPLIMPKLQRAAQLQAPLVLSGFPRNLDQLTMLQQAGVPTLPTVVHLELPRVIAERRLADRHICANCGEPMRRIEPPTTGEGAVPAGLWAHLLEEATECDAPSPRRAAIDEADAARERLDAFDAQTLPLLARLEQRGAAVHNVVALENFDETWAAVEAACGLEPLHPEPGGT